MVSVRTESSSTEDVTNETFVPSDFERVEETKTKNTFVMVHKGSDRSKDRRVSMKVEDGDPIWEGINCRSIEFAISRMSKSVQKRHPFSCLSLTLQQGKDNSDGLRPASEIHAFLSTNRKFKTTNPQ